MSYQYLKSKFLTIGLVVAGLVLTSCTVAKAPEFSAIKDTSGEQAALTSELVVFRSPTCGCCGSWIEHMKAAGFQVKDKITEDMTAIKQRYGIPANLASCHTTIMDGYVVEGHIPAKDVQRLLTEKPDVDGVAVPGMPIGSPGMESGDYVEPYTVFSFRKDGAIAAFAEHS
ncbi:MAG: DUF411 domain-containing protein [Leptolyngbyaceae cyanobacterium MO_188.B28]|nr:DUF411 domain-containing protein [Leptolyngbyaceae cyanobacterium MO_188.B28]